MEIPQVKVQKSKKKACKKFYKNFVSELKVSNPSKYFKMAKEIGASNQTNHGDIKIECLENLSAQDQVQTVAESMAEISNQYSPIDLCQLPAYLPAQEAPQIELYKVYKKFKDRKRHAAHLTLICRPIYEKRQPNSLQNLSQISSTPVFVKENTRPHGNLNGAHQCQRK